MILSPNDVKGITEAVFGVIAVFFFIKAFKRAKEQQPIIPFFVSNPCAKTESLGARGYPLADT